MVRAFGAWERYFYPPPDDATLRNLFDERNPRVLARLEYVEASERARELFIGPADVPRTFDAAHLRAIHRHLFQDVYEWAGQYRTVNITKGAPGGFADVGSGQIDRYLADAHAVIDSAGWAGLDRRGFVAVAAEVFAYVNQAHPLREGNGRASKVFMDHLAALSRFRFDYGWVEPEAWSQASLLSGPDLGAYRPRPESLAAVFDRITEER